MTRITNAREMEKAGDCSCCYGFRFKLSQLTYPHVPNTHRLSMSAGVQAEFQSLPKGLARPWISRTDQYIRRLDPQGEALAAWLFEVAHVKRPVASPSFQIVVVVRHVLHAPLYYMQFSPCKSMT